MTTPETAWPTRATMSTRATRTGTAMAAAAVGAALWTTKAVMATVGTTKAALGTTKAVITALVPAKSTLGTDEALRAGTSLCYSSALVVSTLTAAVTLLRRLVLVPLLVSQGRQRVTRARVDIPRACARSSLWRGVGARRQFADEEVGLTPMMLIVGVVV